MHRSYKDTMRGFTLVELLIVVGLFAILAGLAVSAALHTHSGFNAKDDEDLAIATLQKARSQSMNGVCIGACGAALAHGVHIQTHSLVLFQGSTYNPADSANEYIEAQSNATTFSGNDIIFALSGAVGATSTLTIFDYGTSTDVVTIGVEGQILWSN